MEVYQCLIWGYLPEDIISKNLVGFVENMIRNKKSFKLKSVPENTDPSPIVDGIIGYHPYYGMAYLSNPDSDTGISGIDIENKRLIYEKEGGSFNDHKDKYMYINPEHTYIRQSYPEVLNEFKKAEYKILNFVPEHIGDMLIRHKDFTKIQTSSELNIKNLL